MMNPSHPKARCRRVAEGLVIRHLDSLPILIFAPGLYNLSGALLSNGPRATDN